MVSSWGKILKSTQDPEPEDSSNQKEKAKNILKFLIQNNRIKKLRIKFKFLIQRIKYKKIIAYFEKKLEIKIMKNFFYLVI